MSSVIIPIHNTVIQKCLTGFLLYKNKIFRINLKVITIYWYQMKTKDKTLYQITLRVTKEEYDLIKGYCNKNTFKIGKWIVKVILVEIDKHKEKK